MSKTPNISRQRTGKLMRTLFEILLENPDGIQARDAIAFAGDARDRPARGQSLRARTTASSTKAGPPPSYATSAVRRPY